MTPFKTYHTLKIIFAHKEKVSTIYYVIMEITYHVKTQKYTSKECIGARTSQQLKERPFNLMKYICYM
jgi:hypothetical protein